MRALVIDDSKSIRSILTRILSGVGFEVDEAANGLEALELRSEERRVGKECRSRWSP